MSKKNPHGHLTTDQIQLLIAQRTNAAAAKVRSTETVRISRDDTDEDIDICGEEDDYVETGVEDEETGEDFSMSRSLVWWICRHGNMIINDRTRRRRRRIAWTVYCLFSHES